MKTPAILVLVAAVAVAGAWIHHAERNDRRHDVSRLEAELKAVRRELAVAKRQDEVLAAQVRAIGRRARNAQIDLAPLAARLKRSVFTVKASRDEGTGFAAWVRGRSTYVVTANHVVILSVDHHELTVSLYRGNRKWLGRIVRTDPDNDLALIRVRSRIGPPLWQRPVYTPPLVGDELLLVGAPEGYEGSVTSGIVSRVSRAEIQTDASAHPGVSGGPIVDADGAVAGVLVSGEGENLNFAVPIGRACAKLRSCARRGRPAPARRSGL